MLVLIWGCSTTNHAILPTQAFLDITSHYNAYFNSNEKLKTTLRNAEIAHKEKFDSVLSVYYYNDAKEFASYSGDLDDVIKRSTLAVQLRGAANWSDDHFLLIGISNYLKGDYDKAAASFKYITTEYKEGVDYIKVMKSLGKKPGKYVKAKKKKKKPEVKVIVNKDGTQTLEKIDKRPKFSLWIHEPARSEALIWLIKTYARQKKYDEAQTVLTYVRGDDLFYQNLDSQLDLAEADLNVSRKNYAAAIEPLEKYLKAKGVKKRKKLKVRPLFVLAQCYQEIGNYGKAIENYKLVLKNRPNYDMEFYAKIKMAKLGRAGGGNAAMRALLAKMAKDGSYKEYWDQIYYELALLSLSESNRVEARKFLHKSIDNSLSNDDQKALSFLKLAELDYEDEAYVQSKFFYDSTLSFMAKNDERYPDIEERDKLLENLVKQLDIIYQEDSLQALALLPENERAKKIREAIARKEKEEEDRKQAEEDAKQQGVNPANQNQNNTVVQQTQNTSGSTWYFYNSTVRASGYNDFIRRWGRRKLEENWRRKNKSSAIVDDEIDAPSADSVAVKDNSNAVKTGTPEEQMAENIPTTPEKLAASTDKITDAYYTAGTIYKDGLESYNNAEKIFETLNAKYPNNKLLLESYYNLYLIALKKNDSEKAARYKNLILEKFPESVIAKVLRNPNYLNEAKKQEQAVDDFYQLAYNDYKRDSLDACWYKCEMADNMFKPNPLSAKFELLNALVLAKRNRLNDYVQALNKIVNKTKDAEVKKTATELLANLNKSSLPQIDLSKDSTRRDSLNSLFFKPDTSLGEVQKQLNEAKEQAKKSGAVVAVDTTTKQQTTNNNQQLSNTGDSTKPGSTVVKDTTAQQPKAVAEDTTSPYSRTDAAVHYFVIYIKDPATPQSAIMSTMAKIDAFNSSLMPEKKLVSKQVMIDSKNKLINVRQFKNKDDVMAYYKLVKNQSQLFNDFQPTQFAITCISTANFSVLLSEKDIDLYNTKFFTRVYK